MPDRLKDYRSRRDESTTPEPTGGSPRRDGSARFVIQHHAASSDHYDLRLEHDGVLLSWAVPKGPSTDPRERRLATRTEDHPLDYAQFEGTIPEGEYGAGEVVVWDTGTWHALTHDGDVDVDAALADGHLSFELHGEKISGGYTLQRFREDWLLIKQDDDAADARRRPTSTEPESVLSGRTVSDVAQNAARSTDEDA